MVGLGPAGTELMLPAARDALTRIPTRYARTSRHPAVAQLAAEGLVLEPLDLLYDSGDDLDTVYAAIAARVVEAAHEHGEVAYAVPGSPSVAERTVALLRGAGIDIEIVPGLSFADLAWNRLGIDPMTGARVVDARAFAVDSAGFAGPMLLAQCDTRFVSSDVKLALLEDLAPDHEVTVLQGLGLPDERVFTVALADLDRAVEPDHLTSLFVDTGEVAVGAELARLVALTQRLRPGRVSVGRRPNASLAAPARARRGVRGRGGDRRAAARRARRRHPGRRVRRARGRARRPAVPGDDPLGARGRSGRVHDRRRRATSTRSSCAGIRTCSATCAQTADAVVTNWEQIKKAEKGHTSLVEGITPGLPSLLYAQKLFRKAASVGLAPDVAEISGVDVTDERALGDALAALAAAGARAGVDGESALAGWARRFKDRFTRMEQLAADARVDLARGDRQVVERLWRQAAELAVPDS